MSVIGRTVDRESRVFSVELPIATPSQNEIQAWKYTPSMRLWRYKTYKASLEQLLADAFDSSPLTQPPTGRPRRMRVTVTRYSRGTLDDANLRGGCKPLLDALVDLRILHDDSPAWLEDHYRQEPAAKGEKRTRLDIEAIDG